MKYYLNTPIKKKEIKKIKAGDEVCLSGYIYTARDAAHKRMIEDLEHSRELPFEIKKSIIYYTGPTETKPGNVIGSAGPTTSSRMDRYSQILIREGQSIIIGKGEVSPDVIDSIKNYDALYLVAIGGTGALISKHIMEAEIIGYEDLCTEAIRKLHVNKLPLIVAIDSYGNNLYEKGRMQYLSLNKNKETKILKEK